MAYQTYIGDARGSIPAVAFVNSEGGLIGQPGPGSPQLFNATEFVSLMDRVLNLQSQETKLKKNPSNPKITAELALTYFNLGNFEKGQPLADKALKLDTENRTGLLPEINLNLGLHHLGLYHGSNGGGENTEENLQKAETFFKTVVEKYPQSAAYESAQLNLGRAYAIQEKYHTAIATLEKLSEAKDPAIKARASQFLDHVRNMAKSEK